MAEWTSTLADWSIRSIGAVAGASVSLVYLLPKRRQEAVSRFIVGMVCGVIFAQAAGQKLVEWMALDAVTSDFEATLMGAAAASFASWWALGLLVRVLDRAGGGLTIGNGSNQPEPTSTATLVKSVDLKP
jgi:hypothetical protein